jgi:hypothetical protein
MVTWVDLASYKYIMLIGERHSPEVVIWQIRPTLNLHDCDGLACRCMDFYHFLLHIAIKKL